MVSDNGVRLNFWFRADKVPMDQCIELDRRMRKAVDATIVKGEGSDG
jgi:hypothetical protein